MSRGENPDILSNALSGNPHQSLHLSFAALSSWVIFMFRWILRFCIRDLKTSGKSIKFNQSNYLSLWAIPECELWWFLNFDGLTFLTALVLYSQSDYLNHSINWLIVACFIRVKSMLTSLLFALKIKSVLENWKWCLGNYRILRKRLEHSRSVGRNTRRSRVFLPTLISCSSRLLRALQQNRAQSRLLYLLINM